MNELALFAGAGGGILGGKLLGWKTVCSVERDAYAAAVLAQRQNDGLIDIFPIWSDICTFDGKPWKGIIDVISGGFPCQDISIAGSGKGIDGDRSGLWSEMWRIIREVKPKLVYVENSPALIFRGLGRILRDLAEIGYDAEWGVLGAGGTGSCCKGERIWIIAIKADSAMLEGVDIPKLKIINSKESRRRQYSRAVGSMLSQDDYTDLKRNTNEVARGMDRLKAIGNGQDPICAAEAFRQLILRFNISQYNQESLPLCQHLRTK